MKKRIMPFVGAKHGKSLAMILSFVVLSNFSFSQAGAGTDPVNPANVKYITSYNDKQYFQVQYNNDSADKFSLTIKDKEGFILFRETYADKNFDKKFQLNKMDGNNTLTFIIRDLKTNNVQSFEINTTSRMVDDVVVTKIK